MSITEVLATHKLVPVGFDCFPVWLPAVAWQQRSFETSQKLLASDGIQSAVAAATKLDMLTANAVANAKINYKTKPQTHTHTGSQPHLPVPDSWLLNSGNIIKLFTFDSQPALKLINSLSVCVRIPLCDNTETFPFPLFFQPLHTSM